MNVQLAALPLSTTEYETVRKHLPPRAWTYVLGLLQSHPVLVRVVPHRATKLGDSDYGYTVPHALCLFIQNPVSEFQARTRARSYRRNTQARYGSWIPRTFISSENCLMAAS